MLKHLSSYFYIEYNRPVVLRKKIHRYSNQLFKCNVAKVMKMFQNDDKVLHSFHGEDYLPLKGTLKKFQYFSAFQLLEVLGCYSNFITITSEVIGSQLYIIHTTVTTHVVIIKPYLFIMLYSKVLTMPTCHPLYM